MTTIRFHIKTLTTPSTPIDTMITSMRQTYAQYGIGVEVASIANLSAMPNAALLLDLDVGACTTSNVTAELNQLFGDGQASWSGWFNLGGPGPGMVGGPATISRNPGVANIYAWGGDNALWQRA